MSDFRKNAGASDQLTVKTTGGSPHTGLAGEGHILDNKRRVQTGASDSVIHQIQEPAINFGSTDGDSNAYFSQSHPDVQWIRTFDCRNEPWHDPTGSLLTGYGRDGVEYLAGVAQNGGAVAAPWALEGVNANRSSRQDFPIRGALVQAYRELVILDYDSWPTVKMWARLPMISAYSLVGNFGSDGWYDGLIRNGVLTGVGFDGGSQTRLFHIDFKGLTPTTDYILLGNDNSWGWNNTWANRAAGNFWSTSFGPSFRLQHNSGARRVAAHLDTAGDLYIAISGLGGCEVIKTWDHNAQSVGDLEAAGAGVCFDKEGYGRDKGWGTGMLFAAYGSVVFRHGTEYKQGALNPDTTWHQRPPKPRQRDYVDLGSTINYLAPGDPYVYAATDVGVFQIHQGSLATKLIYSIPTGAGEGVDLLSGKIIPGNRLGIEMIRSHVNNSGAFLAIGTGYQGGNVNGGVAVTRQSDGLTINTYQYPDMAQDGSRAIDLFTHD